MWQKWWVKSGTTCTSLKKKGQGNGILHIYGQGGRGERVSNSVSYSRRFRLQSNVKLKETTNKKRVSQAHRIFHTDSAGRHRGGGRSGRDPGRVTLCGVHHTQDRVIHHLATALLAGCVRVLCLFPSEVSFRSFRPFSVFLFLSALNGGRGKHPKQKRPLLLLLSFKLPFETATPTPPLFFCYSRTQHPYTTHSLSGVIGSLVSVQRVFPPP